jgi:NAD+ synthase
VKRKKAAETLLRIDVERAVEASSAHLRGLCANASATDVLIGLSGGVDSTLLAALAVRALGEQAIHTAYLYDPDSDRGQGALAGAVADWLGIDLERESIESRYDDGARDGDRGVRAVPLSVRLTRLSPAANRVLFRLYRLATGEAPFAASLRAGRAVEERAGSAGRLLTAVNRWAEEIFYARHRYRRQVLEVKAAERNWVLLGAANRTELEVGWFVRGGVDDLPEQPLIGLYKTQVRQLAQHLGVPRGVLQQAPSPDMMRGITDEYALGLSYDKLDVGLDRLAGGVTADEARDAGVTDADLRLIHRLRELSMWKRSGAPPSFPIDGGPDGGLRV